MAREEGFFDELARGLADGSLSRGKALRLMGAALVGGTLASLGIGEAGADPPGCKRAGKHCTRNDQCCGSLVCVSGTCQTQTTTPTPTTSTTETPTTSTTTTTCSGLPNGATCTTSGECCSGNCHSSGFCLPPTGTIDVSCNCSEASGTLHTIHLACLSECPQLDTFTPVCTSVCENSRLELEFVSGGCVSDAPLCACPGCPEPCVCVEDLENPGVQACVSPLSQIVDNCDLCPEGTVCHGDPTVGEVGCSARCPETPTTTTTESPTTTTTETPTTTTTETPTTTTTTAPVLSETICFCSDGSTPSLGCPIDCTIGDKPIALCEAVCGVGNVSDVDCLLVPPGTCTPG